MQFLRYKPKIFVSHPAQFSKQGRLFWTIGKEEDWFLPGIGSAAGMEKRPPPFARPQAFGAAIHTRSRGKPQASQIACHSPILSWCPFASIRGLILPFRNATREKKN
jgi:hypothetical protein